MTDAERQFINFVSENHRSYGTKEEYEYRLSLFTQAIELVKSHNAENHKFTLGLNNFADMSDFEYKQLLGYKPELRPEGLKGTHVATSVAAYPSSIDWSTTGAVTPVKNQGSCGSCWAFSAVGAVEGRHYITNNNLLNFSEQQLVDCAFLKGYGNLGCSGGLMDSAFQYGIDFGHMGQTDYPYVAKRGPCTADTKKVQTGLKAFTDVTPNSIDALLQAASEGPVSVAIEADKAAFQLYKKGVITGTACGTALDHGVLVVGYGTDPDGTDWYKVKNSWGATWGEAGYVRIGRETGNGVCGIQMQPSWPIVNKQ